MYTTDDLHRRQRLLVRIDVNAPVEDGAVQSTRRFERHADSIADLLREDHGLALLAHQGRPGRDTFVTLEEHAEILSDLLGYPVEYVPSTHGEEALDVIEDLGAGNVVLLENTRMTDDELPEEAPDEKAETEFVQALAPEFDAYVNDGYSVAHRSHASIVGFPEVMDAYAGPVMADEYEYNTSLERREFDGQVTMILGGTKAEDVIAAMDNLEDRVDRFLLGGVVGELFLRAEGHPVGHDLPDGPDLYDDNYAENEELIADVHDRFGDRIELPTDLAYEAEAEAESEDEPVEEESEDVPEESESEDVSEESDSEGVSEEAEPEGAEVEDVSEEAESRDVSEENDSEDVSGEAESEDVSEEAEPENASKMSDPDDIAEVLKPKNVAEVSEPEGEDEDAATGVEGGSEGETEDDTSESTLETDGGIEGGERAEHRVEEIDEKRVSYMDIGHETAERYVEVIEESEAVLVKGALGVFEDERFSHGTVEVLQAVADSDAFSVVGGGDTSRAVPMYGIDEDGFDHLSIAGGAYLKALTGEPLVGIEALERSAERMDED